MAELLLQILYFLRPLMFVYVDVSIFGLSMFEVLTLGIVIILFAAFLFTPLNNRLRLDRLDVVMLVFIIWCGIVLVIQWEQSDVRATMKWALPFVMYIVLRRVVRSEKVYFRCLRNLLIGFSILIPLNVAAIWFGRSLYTVNWYTGLERHLGVFKDLHSMGHTMGFAIMFAIIYLGLLRAWRGPAAWRMNRLIVAMCVVLIPLAGYSLFKGNVRTVILGVALFVGVLLFQISKKYLIAFLASLVAIWSITPLLNTLFWDVAGGKGVGSTIEMAGSGRPFIWKHNLQMYAELPIEQKILGLGIGNEIGVMPASGVITYEYRSRAWESHNDFLSALMELGLVGLILVLAIFYLILQGVLRMPPAGRPYFLSLLIAVIIMNFLSNSYLNRFGLGQLFVMLMIGVDVARVSQLRPAVAAGHIAQLSWSRIARSPMEAKQ